ncbi:MAG: RdgB/HAM1 family non-canonical purine NTP pyrophosphatase [Chitinivibrionia bacterium]|nr:RdgB/HAM1 family non-canonical purine NTP pyrophosphatase [Chitinivibrionia bacterium]
MKVLIASSNLGKVKEIGEILKKIDKKVEILSLKDIFDEVPDIPENARTFTGNALAKANFLAKKSAGNWILADDSGLVVSALKGNPGVRSARYAGEIKDDKKNIEKLLGEMQEFVEEEQRSAHFCCAMVLVSPNTEKSFAAIGKCKGKIAFEEKGDGGFGYDPIFIPEGYDKTFGELSSSVKNKISHRAKALEILSDIFKDVLNGGEI